MVKSKILFRDGASDFFKAIISHQINCYIVSGGIRCVMVQCLDLLAAEKSITGLDKWVKICATEEKYDEEKKLVAFRKPYITSINKPDGLTHDKFPEIKPTINAIIVGDYLLDTHAGDNLNIKTSLTIGFYNGRGDGTLKEYLLAYDMVILGDGSYSLVTEMISKVARGDFECEYKQVGMPGEHYQFFTKL